MSIKPLKIHSGDFIPTCEITADYGSLNCPFSERELASLIEGVVPACQERFNDGLNFDFHFGHPPPVTWFTNTSNFKVNILGVATFLMYERIALHSFSVYVDFLPRWWCGNERGQPFTQDMFLGKRRAATEYTVFRAWHNVGSKGGVSHGVSVVSSFYHRG